MNHTTVIHWFRQDLRLADNPALYEAAQHDPVLPIFILDDHNAGDYALGAASRWWLYYSLNSLKKDLKNSLQIFEGDPQQILQVLIEKYGVKKVFWNRCYEPWRVKRDKRIKSVLEHQGVEVNSYNGSLLWEPWEIKKKDGTPYKVFTPYFRKGCLTYAAPRKPLPRPGKLRLFSSEENKSSIEALSLLPKLEWGKQFESHWKVGEKHAYKRLENFLEHGLDDYKEGRNYPAKQNVSRLSPYLHFGEISANQVWYESQAVHADKNLEHFHSELGWREFSYSLLYYSSDLARINLQTKFDNFPWLKNMKNLQAWQQGVTGFPIVDAGMRELWQTGYMHSRVRMIVGSFLVKNLLLHWHHGFEWFWDCLLDADLANNAASWQWIAGCGADAAPYFRVFNPVIQGSKFDAEGEYTKRYVPELKNLPAKYLFNPWAAPQGILSAADVSLGKDYPKPIVDVKLSRLRALAAFKSLAKQKLY